MNAPTQEEKQKAAESDAMGVAYAFRRLNDVAAGFLELCLFKLQYKDV